jgi:hypothetical protein
VLEIDLDEDEALVVLAENGLEETATAEDLLEDQIVRRRQVVEAVLGGGDLCRPHDLVAHAVTVDVSFGCIWILVFGFYRFARRKCKVFTFSLGVAHVACSRAITTSVEKKKKKPESGRVPVGSG